MKKPMGLTLSFGLDVMHEDLAQDTARGDPSSSFWVLEHRVGNAEKAVDLRGCSSPEEDHPTQTDSEEVTVRLSGGGGPWGDCQKTSQG